MAWYDNPTIAGVIGALVGGAFTAGIGVLIWRLSRKTTRLSCAVFEPTSLLAISDHIRDKLKVTYEDDEVTSAFHFTVQLVNTGTEPIEDQPILLSLPEGSTIIDYRIETEPKKLFGPITEKKTAGNELSLEIALLNEQNRVTIDVFSIENPSPAIDVSLKNKGVQTRVYTPKSVNNLLSSLSADSWLAALIGFSTVPILGGAATRLATLEVARRLSKAGKDSTGSP